ncbi:hypothetical protein BJ138DRAFT_1141249 [Hygrophoropsis aurantiaca]|uniref:Uncharacterized protein n=1 Tax=Hygrophoropsis aurantiaca TaxID=72124 RepID=A0ACB8AQ33_9AGAM|nr:hypothetical protein BJ138DRAFT_1141249 [Hygrophoropsis aurantiaca]
MSYSSLRNGNGATPILPNQGRFSSFSIPQSVFQPPNLPPISTSTPAAAPTPSAFKAPAHKHAHHLHSIPPREKSTRTLIIDHMLWVHARTRFAQARAELGMTDRTGGPTSSNYRHRERPETYEEEEEHASEGEDVRILKAREGGPAHTHNDDEDDRIQKQDLLLARGLRLRAEGLEKVVASMLDQPPPVHPILDDEPSTPPTSPQHPDSQNSPQRNSSHPHTLPNGVRLRLALGAVINDLFARQAPPPPYRHHHHPPPIIVSANGSDQASSSGLTPGNSPILQKASPTSSIRASSTSSFASSYKIPPSLHVLSSISAAASTSHLSSNGEFRLPTPSQARVPGTVNWRAQSTPSARVRALYMEGADPSTANSPPGLRCPRHLHTGCEICVEAKQPIKVPGGPGRARASSSTGGLGSVGMWAGESSRRGVQIDRGRSMGGSGGGITGWQDGSGIGSGLARPGVDGSVLRRKSKWFLPDIDNELTGITGAGAGNTRLSELIPRFVRLSALVAMELGQELGDEEYGGEEGDWQKERSMGASSSPAPTSPYMTRRPQVEIDAPPLRPSREWYMLLAGLLTRAALEGYLTGGWRGLDAAECLLSVGLGMNDDGSRNQNVSRDSSGHTDDTDEEDSAFEWFDPDDLPGLKEAIRIMFPTLQRTRNGESFRREGAEAEFEAEMEERLRKFYAIPALTPDLSTHMEDLAWHYPAEPVERAALRFCEAIAKWRGKPELETYKKKPKDFATPGGSSMTIESLVHSNPTSPTSAAFPVQESVPKSNRPPIEKYFTPPSYSGWGRNKRRRSFDDGEVPVKRAHG